MNKMHIVYTTLNHPTPQIFTFNEGTAFEFADKFFDYFCDLEEVVSAVLFAKTGEFITTYNG